MNRPRLMVAGVFAGFAVLALLAALVFKFGQHNPSPRSLQDKPNPSIPGEVIYLDPHQCISRIDASGANRREVLCAGPIDFVVRLDEQYIVYGTFRPGGVQRQRNLVTGEERTYSTPLTPDKVPSIHFAGSEQPSARGEYVTVDRDGSVYRSGGDEQGRTRIFDCDCPEFRAPQFLTWSPDGEWVMLGYGKEDKQELWVIARDGSFAGTLADAGYNPGASWFIPGAGLAPKPALAPNPR